MWWVLVSLGISGPSERANLRDLFLERMKPEVTMGSVRGRSKRLALIDVGDGARLEIEAGVFFLWMKAEAKRDGVVLRIESAFRAFEQQARLHRCFVECSCNGCRRAARPGFSPHEAGRAIDLDLSSLGASAWLEEHAARFGFAASVGEEPWHYEFVGAGERSTSTARAPAGAR